MPRIQIDSIKDPRIEIYRDLPGSPADRWSGLFIAESEQVVLRLLDTEYEVVSALVTERAADRIGHRMPESANLYVAPEKLVREIVGFKFHRGAVACGRRKPRPTMDELMPSTEKPFTVVICPHLVDPVNLGGILRICAVFGADAVLVGTDSTDPFSRRVIRVSMGAALTVPVLHCEELEAVVDRMRKEYNVEVIATVTDEHAEPLPGADRPARVGLMLGHEGQGLNTHWQSLCDRRVTVPMEPGVDSLNVATTAGILLYHFTRARPYT